MFNKKGKIKLTPEKSSPAAEALNAIFDDEAVGDGIQRIKIIGKMIDNAMGSQSDNDGEDFIIDDDGGGYRDELLNASQFKKYEDRQRAEYKSKKPIRGIPFN